MNRSIRRLSSSARPSKKAAAKPETKAEAKPAKEAKAEAAPKAEARPAKLAATEAAYTDDISLPGQTYAYFLRSPYAHARIRSLNTAEAAKAPGVLGIFTGEHFKAVGGLPCGWLINSLDGQPMKEPKHPVLADGKVRYVAASNFSGARLAEALDLQAENSFVRYAVEQGNTVFLVSWRNPDASMASRTWDDYIEGGAIEAIRVAREISAQDQINVLGFCVGGTILSTALAVLAERGEHPAASLTLLTTLLDFESTGVLDIFIDEASVQLRDMTIGADAPGGPGLLKGRELATTFSFLRPNDLVWNYVVGNYLKGESDRKSVV